MAEESNIGEQAAPPRQTPFKAVVPAASNPPAPDSAAPAAPAPAAVAPAAPAAAPAAPAGDAPAPSAPRTVILRRPTLRRPGEAPKSPISPISPISPKTVTLKPPVGAQPASQVLSKTDMVAKGIEISHSDAAKKVTSRISVSSATSPIPPLEEVAAAQKAPAPARPVSSPLTPHVAAAESPKKVTSRISLESAFTSQPDAAPAQPKTIRLKRPSEVAAPHAAPSAPAQPADAAPASAQPLPEGMTPISEIEGQAAPEEPLTRRKTIKVKRPGAAPATGPTISIPRPDGVASESDNLQSLSNFAAGARPKGSPDKVNPFFIVAAVFAIVFASLLIWVLTSQTYGERGAAGDYALPKGPSISPPPWLKTFD